MNEVPRKTWTVNKKNVREHQNLMIRTWKWLTRGVEPRWWERTSGWRLSCQRFLLSTSHPLIRRRTGLFQIARYNRSCTWSDWPWWRTRSSTCTVLLLSKTLLFLSLLQPALSHRLETPQTIRTPNIPIPHVEFDSPTEPITPVCHHDHRLLPVIYRLTQIR